MSESIFHSEAMRFLDPYRPDFIEIAYWKLSRGTISLEEFRDFIIKIEERAHMNALKGFPPAER